MAALTLNRYMGTYAQNEMRSVVAPDMATALQALFLEAGEPLIFQIIEEDVIVEEPTP